MGSFEISPTLISAAIKRSSHKRSADSSRNNFVQTSVSAESKTDRNQINKNSSKDYQYFSPQINGIQYLQNIQVTPNLIVPLREQASPLGVTREMMARGETTLNSGSFSAV